MGFTFFSKCNSEWFYNVVFDNTACFLTLLFCLTRPVIPLSKSELTLFWEDVVIDNLLQSSR